MVLAAFQNHMEPYKNHWIVTLPAANVVETTGLSPLAHEVRIWLLKSVGDNRGDQRPEETIWDYVGCFHELATFAFRNQEDATLFRLFWG